jgi:phage baseplate assembly protein W
MAQRKEYRIHPLDLKRNVAIGVVLPMGGAPLFKLSYTTEEQALSNLKNLLLTRKGERPFQPLFGTNIYSILFEQLSLDTSTVLKNSLEDDIRFWLPYIVIDDLVITQEEDFNRINIMLNVRVSQNGTNTPIIIMVSDQGSITIV